MPNEETARNSGSSLFYAQSGRRASAQESADLEQLASKVDQALKPVRPRYAYRQALHRDLVLTAQYRRTPHLLIQNPFDRQRLIMLGALIGSAISVIGGIIAMLVVRTRTLQSRTEQR